MENANSDTALLVYPDNSSDDENWLIIDTWPSTLLSVGFDCRTIIHTNFFLFFVQTTQVNLSRSTVKHDTNSFFTRFYRFDWNTHELTNVISSFRLCWMTNFCCCCCCCSEWTQTRWCIAHVFKSLLVLYPIALDVDDTPHVYWQQLIPHFSTTFNSSFISVSIFFLFLLFWIFYLVFCVVVLFLQFSFSLSHLYFALLWSPTSSTHWRTT